MRSIDQPSVVFVLDKPVQHYAESFRHATRSQRVNVSVMYWTDNKGGRFDEGFGRHVSWDADLLSGYQWRQAVGARPFRKVVSFVRSMRELEPDMVVCVGWATGIARLAIVWSIVSRTPILF